MPTLRSEGPQHVTVHGRDEVVVIAAEEFRRLKGDLTGQALFVAFSPWKEQAGRRLSTAAIEGDLPIYIFACSNRLIRTVGRDGDRDRSLVGEQVPLAQQRSACAAKNL